MKMIRIAGFLLFCTTAMAAAQQAPDGSAVQRAVSVLRRIYICRAQVHPGRKGRDVHIPDRRRIGTLQHPRSRRLADNQQVQTEGLRCGRRCSQPAIVWPAAQHAVQCGGNATLTLTQCQPLNGRDFCMVKLEQNGQFVTQLPKAKSDIEQELRERQCKAGIAINPPYLTQFPSKEIVVQGMKVQAPRETVIRSIGALYQLSEIIQTLAQARGGALTADEKKLIDQYSAEITSLQQAAAKNLNGEQLTLAGNPYHFSRSDPRFGFEGIPVWISFTFAHVAGAIRAGGSVLITRPTWQRSSRSGSARWTMPTRSKKP